MSGWSYSDVQVVTGESWSMKKEQKIREPAPPEITDEVLQGVIDLARLDPLSPGMSLQKEHLRKILEHFKVLNEVDIEGLDPTIQINATVISLRPDEVVRDFSKDEALSNSRLRTDEFFRAPLILYEDESDE